MWGILRDVPPRKARRHFAQDDGNIYGRYESKIMKDIYRLVFVGILVLGWCLRTWMVNWDSGYHFHPDERHIVMVAERMEWVNPWSDWEVFSSVESPMNPKFFAYGSLPLYLLGFVGWIAGLVIDPVYGQYDSINIVGRLLSALFDTGTVWLLFAISKRLGKISGWDERTNTVVGLSAAGLYAVSLLPVQLSHFYAVDTLLTFFIVMTLYWVLRWMDEQSWWWLPVIGLSLGMAAATKTTALAVLLPVALAIGLRMLRNIHMKDSKVGLLSLLEGGLQMWVVVGSALLMFVICEPYAVIDFKQFVADHRLQSEMADNAWIFPYTLQYVGTIPYLYPLEQIVRWGLGWPLGIFSWMGLLLMSGWVGWYSGWMVIRWLTGDSMATWKRSLPIWEWLVLLSFGVTYFGVFGGFAVKFMRYMLPIYPLLILAGVWGVWRVIQKLVAEKRAKWWLGGVAGGVGILALGWTMAFLSMYTKENTRLQASPWMEARYGPGTQLAIEHWDDAIPVPPWHENFVQLSLPLYEPDTKEKWEGVTETLEQAEVIAIASNRLYDPLQRLAWKFPYTARYYQLLFGEALGYELVTEFAEYPTVLGWKIDDQPADESFHVYDHPKILIYEKKEQKTKEELFDLIVSSSPVKSVM